MHQYDYSILTIQQYDYSDPTIQQSNSPTVRLTDNRPWRQEGPDRLGRVGLRFDFHLFTSLNKLIKLAETSQTILLFSLTRKSSFCNVISTVIALTFMKCFSFQCQHNWFPSCQIILPTGSCQFIIERE